MFGRQTSKKFSANLECYYNTPWVLPTLRTCKDVILICTLDWLSEDILFTPPILARENTTDAEYLLDIQSHGLWTNEG